MGDPLYTWPFPSSSSLPAVWGEEGTFLPSAYQVSAPLIFTVILKSSWWCFCGSERFSDLDGVTQLGNCGVRFRPPGLRAADVLPTAQRQSGVVESARCWG